MAETLDQKFERLQEWGTQNIDEYTSRFNYNALLNLYANWKVARDGPAPEDNPRGPMGQEQMKWARWKAESGKTTEQAKIDYIEIIEGMNAELIRLGVMEATEESDPL